METGEKSGGVGGIMGAIIIIVILAAGAWYFIGNRVEKIETLKVENQKAVEEAKVNPNTSSEIIDIQADLNNLDLKVLNN